MVYDYLLEYPIGRIETIDGIPNKLDKDTYIMTDLIQIPKISTGTE